VIESSVVDNYLKSKYGSSIEEILNAYEAKQERLLHLKDYDTYLADLKEKVKSAEKNLQKYFGDMDTEEESC
jgi:DNA repair protein RecN (Recombination protein N)